MSPDPLSEIGLVARRVRRFAASIVQGHALGITPGDVDDMLCPDYHAAAVDVYAETLPWPYLVGLARSFDDRARIIDEHLADDDDASVVGTYLRAVAGAITEAAPRAAVATPPLEELDDTTPPIMPFGRLAAMVSAPAANQLLEAAARVEQTLRDHVDPCPLTDEELNWLRRLREGGRIVDIARDHGLAERTLYRALNDIWARLGVDNRIDGVATVVANGWLDR